ncbi:MAG: caspase family protein [Pseudoflavonifractor sp.]|nr:caspase family protein [Alloprevotella sp.]MCM1116537.1 caspase family protein [Pseudoflavonifractor sp.]
MIRILFLGLCLIGSQLVNAHIVSQNVGKALDILRHGQVENALQQIKHYAAVNDVSAQYYLGQCYELGLGMKADASEAFKMYRRAAERGFPPAMKALARCYSDGIGIECNSTKAQEWFTRYDKRKDTSSIKDIVDIYNEGVALVANGTPSENHQWAKHDQHKASINSAHIPPVYDQPQTPPVTTPLADQEQRPAVKVSDVDIDIPSSGLDNQNLFALIIANENYQDVAAVPNAINDGEILARYCQKTLGIPETNVHLIKDATLNNIRREMNLMSKIAEAYKGEASFLIYYAGHGIPDEETRKSYIMPVDGFIADLSTCISLSDLYDILSNMTSQKTMVILDACFSGASRSDEMLFSARGVAIKSKPGIPKGNMLVISSASCDETAYPFKEQNHGLFTYFLLKKLKETKGNITLGSLMDYVKENVGRKSIVVNGKPQTPSVIASYDIMSEWATWKLY